MIYNIDAMDIRSVDLNLLVALEALLAERNVTRAAARLNLSQSATSAALARLRHVFRDPLLLRTARGMLPTSKALELAEPVQQVLTEIVRLVQPSGPFNPGEARATFKIAASDYVEFTVLPRLLAQLDAQAPGARIAMKAMDFEAIGRWLESGDVDFAIMSIANAPPDVRARALYTEQFVCVARLDHPRVGRTIDLDTFCELDHVMVSARSGVFSGATDEALAMHGRKRRVKLAVPHYLLVPEMVQCSDMIGVVPKRLARHYADRLRLIEPPVPIRGLRVALVWHERTHRDPAQVWLRNVVANSVSEDSNADDASQRRRRVPRSAPHTRGDAKVGEGVASQIKREAKAPPVTRSR